ncbi:MAG: hypothetical protein J7K40_02990 [candidate division Zixibacteria bacterium]|nr:hypothetical protein [candidate division Zixibacteria bacterium]
MKVKHYNNFPAKYWDTTENAYIFTSSILISYKALQVLFTILIAKYGFITLKINILPIIDIKEKIKGNR